MLIPRLPDDCISDYAIDRYQARELEAAEIAKIERHIAACDRCRARKAALATAAAAFLASAPNPPVLSKTTVTLLDTQPRWRRITAPLAASLTAAAALALVLRFGLSPDEGFGTRSKGLARLGFHVKRGAQILDGGNEMIVFPGDRLRFEISTIRPSHVAILSRDGAGKVSEYYPGTGQSRATGAANGQSLESSVELDGTLGSESLYGIFCEQSFALEPLRHALAKDGALPSLPHCIVDSLKIVKTNRP